MATPQAYISFATVGRNRHFPPNPKLKPEAQTASRDTEEPCLESSTQTRTLWNPGPCGT